MKFPVEYNTKVDMKKVQLEIIKPWISQQITKLLGFEDEVLIGYVFGLLEEKKFPDPRHLQVNITGFLEQDSSEFCKELWKLLISAQNSLGGIPPQFLAKKKMDILNRKADSDRIKAELAKRRAEDSIGAAAIDGNGADSVEPPEEEEKKKEKLDKSIEHINQKFKEERWSDDGKRSRKRSRSRERSDHSSRRRSRSRERRRDRDKERDRERRRSSSKERRSSSKERRKSSHKHENDIGQQREQELREKALASIPKKDE